MKVVQGTEEDLRVILHWLEREHAEDGEGFWVNAHLFPRSLQNGQFWLIRHGGEAVAFQAGEQRSGIVSVRKDMRGRGFGSALAKASLARAREADLPVVTGECSPESSLAFWERHGFVRYEDPQLPGKVLIYQVLGKQFEVPEDLPRSTVRIAFFPEAVLYKEGVKPISTNEVVAGRFDDGVLMLERRMVGLSLGQETGRDVVVRIEVDGQEICFCKAKYDQAQDVGVQRDEARTCFFIDEIELPQPC